MIALSVALISAVASILAALVTRNARGAADDARTAVEAHGPTTEAVLAVVLRLEGKVATIGDHVDDLVAWKVLHDHDHHRAASPVPLAVVRNATRRPR